MAEGTLIDTLTAYVPPSTGEPLRIGNKIYIKGREEKFKPEQLEILNRSEEAGTDAYYKLMDLVSVYGIDLAAEARKLPAGTVPRQSATCELPVPEFLWALRRPLLGEDAKMHLNYSREMDYGLDSEPLPYCKTCVALIDEILGFAEGRKWFLSSLELMLRNKRKLDEL
ncbi:MAG: hypothetical protein GY765_31985 [bacterium]|nr:hypothetical protein [bacterium]